MIVDDALKELMTVNGAIVAAVVDSKSGMIYGQAGSGLDLELAAAGNTEVMRAKLQTMKSLKAEDYIEDILITLGKQYHILTPIKKINDVFVYLVLDKARANLALSRRKALDISENIVL